MLHVKRNDQVKVATGKDRGKEGRVLRIMSGRARAIVENINMVKKHVRPNPQRNIQGGLVDQEMPIHLSNLRVICPECGEPTRVGYQKLSDGGKVRVCKKCEATIDK